LNGQAAIFGRTIQQGFEAAKNGAPAVAGSAVPAQVAQAANVAESTVISPSQAEVTDLTTTNNAQTPVQAPAADQAQPAAPVTAPAAVQAPTPEATSQPTEAPQAQAVAATPANPSAELKIYDTTTQPMSQLLAQVQQDGATIVVGP
ncbi:penicillin-binding protein activator, partial [Prolixibacteraceae bacterium JC049]|nr:penicillin-binding protein activator [Prolixibacteraceae bacterium JC049]